MLELLDNSPGADKWNPEGFTKINAVIQRVNEIEEEGLPASGIIETENNLVLKVKVVDLGDWNMDSTATLNVAHGLDYSKILMVSVLIYNDSYDGLGNGVGYDLLNTLVGASSGSQRVGWNSTNLVLARATAGFFDDPGFDSTSFNRGKATIVYIEEAESGS